MIDDAPTPAAAPRQDALASPSALAAIDLGSNSFHMIVAQVKRGHLQIVDRIRHPVRFALGLDERGHISKDARDRALAALEQFGQRVRHLPAGCVRAVGTSTLRRAKESRRFLRRAEDLLGHPIEIISGQEEARLIYVGAAHDVQPPGGRRLAVDIGGGSTEVILGKGASSIERAGSLHMGCVEWTKRFFAEDRVTKKAMNRAVTAARLELEPIKRRIRKTNWDHCLGASGTIRATARYCIHREWSQTGITREALDRLREALVEGGSARSLQGEGLSSDRVPVFAGGVAILSAIFRDLRIERMQVADGALREGVLYELLGRTKDEDVREDTVTRLVKRYEVDVDQAGRVEATALDLLEQVATRWGLEVRTARVLLRWAARLHEIGMSVSYSGYHKHGAYLIENGEMAGFSRGDQRLLALLVLNHRRSFKKHAFESLPPPRRKEAIRLAVLLRLAVRLRRSRASRALPPCRLEVKGRQLKLRLPEDFVAAHPLTQSDLEVEVERLARVGFDLTLS